MDDKKNEMSSLSLEEIDVEELESRLELAVWPAICDCGTNVSCGSNKPVAK